MKTLLHLLTFCLIFLVGGSALGDVPVNLKEDARKAAANLKKLSKPEREAALSEITGLLFMKDGRIAYSSEKSTEGVPLIRDGKVVGKQRIPNRRVFKGAVFVGTDGKLYDFYAATPQKENKLDAWKRAKLGIFQAGKDAVLENFAEEVRELEKRRAVYFLRKLPADMRQAMFAEMLQLLYMEDGSDVFTGATKYEIVSGEKIPYQAMKDSAKFLNAEGTQCDIISELKAAIKRNDGGMFYWQHIKLAIHHQGMNTIFAPFKKEIQAMMDHAGK